MPPVGLLCYFIFWLSPLSTSYILKPNGIVFVIISQPNAFHSNMASALREDILRQASELKQGIPTVYLTHEDFPVPGNWALLPILGKLNNRHRSNTNKLWFFFCDDRTRIRLKQLLNVLGKYEPNADLFLGHPLRDKEATIIHHFAFFQDPLSFAYPDFATGFAVTQTLLEKLSSRIEDSSSLEMDFSIDVQHEFALFIWNNGKGVHLTTVPQLCLRDTEHADCATHYQPFVPCGSTVPSSTMLFAVKTCSKFHEERVSVVKETWAKHAFNIEFYSEIEDGKVPTIEVGVANTERGHCSKTLAILRQIAARELPGINWLILVDDDTILSVGRLQQLLTCYNSSEPVILGERYGFRVLSPHSSGYNYVTGGGGVVFSMITIKHLIESDQCHCPTDDSPDDMFLGFCLWRLGLNITHSSLFHQARPVDYSATYLSHDPPVSFHKYWMIDPIKVYQDWFAPFDLNIQQHYHTPRVEL